LNRRDAKVAKGRRGVVFMVGKKLLVFSVQFSGKRKRKRKR
jgi:hypothetical protein